MKRSAADVSDHRQTTSHRQLPEAEPSPTPLRQLRVGQMLLETTWRIAVPVVLFTGIGIFADLHLGTKPWLTFLGVIIGFGLASLLIAQLLKESENL